MYFALNESSDNKNYKLIKTLAKVTVSLFLWQCEIMQNSHNSSRIPTCISSTSVTDTEFWTKHKPRNMYNITK